jgi:invasion protein IalB
MRNTLIGLSAAAAILVVVFIVSRIIPGAPVHPAQPQATGPTAEEMAQAAAKVTPGFLGATAIGEWNVTCGKPAQHNDASDTGTDLAKAHEIKFGRCRSALLVRNSKDTKKVALIAVFRLIDKSDEVALILHTPPVVKPGTKVLVALAEKQVIGLPVTNCEKGQCIAIGLLKPRVFQQLIGRPKLAVVVPLQANGQRMIIPLSMTGLPQSVEAMRRAG